MHSWAAPQVSPFSFWPTHAPPEQKKPEQQWEILVQLLRQLLPEHAYGQQLDSPPSTQTPLPSQVSALANTPSLHDCAEHTVPAGHIRQAPPPSQLPS